MGPRLRTLLQGETYRIETGNFVETLKYRRIGGDTIEVYKLLTDDYDDNRPM